MKIITKNIKMQLSFKPAAIPDISKCLFFDIETSGFSPKNSDIYLIGIAYFTDECNLFFKQWFLEGLSDEKKALTEFYHTLKDFDFLVHFNGDNFDIPFVKYCLNSYSLESEALDNIKSLDIYKSVRPFKNILGRDKLNQTSLEEFLKLKRDDKYSGGELIKVYKSYMQEATENADLLSLLLLHNECDILGLVRLSALLNYESYFKSDFSLLSYEISRSFVKIDFKTPIKLCKNLEYTYNNIRAELKSEALSLYCPLFEGSLNYYLPNYKDYFYLPKENICIHKDVAMFVDKSAKEKATKENAFLSRNDTFLCIEGKPELKLFSESFDSPHKYVILSEFDFEGMAKLISSEVLKNHKKGKTI